MDNMIQFSDTYDVVVSFRNGEKELVIKNANGYDYSGERKCLIISKEDTTKIIPSDLILEVNIIKKGRQI